TGAVRLVVDEVGLLARRSVANVRHELAPVPTLAVRRELRDRDRRQDADDGNHDEELDQRKTLLLLPLHLGQIAHSILPREFVSPSSRRWVPLRASPVPR